MPDGPGGWGLNKGNGTYMPSPGDGGAGSILRELHVPWPAGNQDATRQAADAWTALANGLADVNADCNNLVASINLNNSGQAIDAFAAHWQTIGGTGGSLTLSIQACTSLAKFCNEYADTVSDAKTQIEHKGEELAAATAAAAIALIFSFGISALVDSAVAEQVVTWASGLVEDIATSVSFASEQLAGDIGLLAAPVGAAAGATITGLAGGVTAGTFGALFDEEFQGSLDALNKVPLPSPGDDVKSLLNNVETGGIIGVLAEAMPAFAQELTTDESAGQAFQSSPQLAAMLSQSSKLAAWLNTATGKAFIEAGGTEALKKAGFLDESGVVSNDIETLLEAALSKIPQAPKTEH